MAGNTGKNSRNGAVKQRTQVYNPKTDSYVKRNTKTGRFVSSKKSTKYKGVTDEKKKKKS
tara:strand:+ start:1594 stop:1773 length:180 start_codon:yes stop_codon:yes gene_type:complete